MQPDRTDLNLAVTHPDAERPVFSIRAATVEYERFQVLTGVSVDVAAGESLAVMGANGSGKSTLMRALLGVVPLASGEIDLYGTPLRAFRQWWRIGYVPQRLAIGGGVPATVQETVASGRIARRRGLPIPRAADRAAVHRALAQTGLLDLAHESVQELSGGQQQRVLIARALAGEPDTLVMDEPMAGVDAEHQQALAHTLGQLASHGHTIVLVLHELGPLAPLVRRSVVLSGGHLVHDGAPPRPLGECARPGHDHVHPHAGPPAPNIALPAVEGLRLD